MAGVNSKTLVNYDYKFLIDRFGLPKNISTLYDMVHTLHYLLKLIHSKGMDNFFAAINEKGFQYDAAVATYFNGAEVKKDFSYLSSAECQKLFNSQ